jgi:hypothetical protein
LVPERGVGRFRDLERRHGPGHQLLLVQRRTTTPAGTAAGSITSGIPGDCLDDWHGQITAGNPVDLYPCDNTSSQDWTVSDNETIQMSGDCVDVSGGSTEGAAVVLDPCSGSETQQWLLGPDGDLVSPHTGFCLDDPGLQHRRRHPSGHLRVHRR